MARNFRGANNLLTTLLLYKLQNNQQQQRDKAAMERLNAENAATMERQTKEQNWRTTENEADRMFDRELRDIDYQNDVGLQGMRQNFDREMQSTLESSRKAQKDADIAREAQKAQEAIVKEDEIAESMLDMWGISYDPAKVHTIAEAEQAINAKKYRDTQQTAIDKKNEGIDSSFVDRSVQAATEFRKTHTQDEYDKYMADENGWKRFERGMSPEEYAVAYKRIITMEDTTPTKERDIPEREQPTSVVSPSLVGMPATGANPAVGWALQNLFNNIKNKRR